MAPTSMSVDQQELWLRAAIDALQDIRVDEVKSIILQLQRTVTRPNQIVPEIARLVAEKRSRLSFSAGKPVSKEWAIDKEAQERRAKAKTQDEIEAAWLWEREARIAAKLPVPPLEPPLKRSEIAKLSPSLVKMGLKCGALVERDGQIVNAIS